MGQNESAFKRTYSDTVSQLSSVQLGEITSRFNELYAKAGGAKGLVVDREAFSQYLNLPVAIGDRLFEAFDEKKNGSICIEEFVCGLAIVLHGSFRDRCGLLFRVFNIGNDEGISREELRTMMTAILQSTNTILYTVGESDRAVLGSEDMQETISAMVEAAFTNCDISRTEKLLPMEFEYWLKRNPKILDTLLSFKTRKDECTLGSLIMSPSEQNFQSAPRLSEHRGSKEKGGGAPQTPTGGRPLFQVGSGKDSLTQLSATSDLHSHATSDLQKGGGPPQTPTGDQVGGRLFQVGGPGEDSLSGSPQVSATSDLQSVAIGTQGMPTESDRGRIVGVVGRGNSLVEIDGDVLCEVGAQTRVAMAMDPEQSQAAGKEPPIAETREAAASQVAMAMDPEQPQAGKEPPIAERNEPISLAMEGSEGREPSIALTMEDSDASIAITVEGNSQSEEVMPAGLEHGNETGLLLQAGSSVPVDSAHDADELGGAGGVEDGHHGTGDVSSLGLPATGLVMGIGEDGRGDASSLGPPGTGLVMGIGEDGRGDASGLGTGLVAGGGGSIMASASDLSINLSAVQVAMDSHLAPASSVLPIQEEVVMGGARLGGGAESPSVEGGKEEVGMEEREVAGIALPFEPAVAAETCPLTGDKVFVAATPTTQQPTAPLPNPPRGHIGRVSPFPEEAEGVKCSENISQAWVLSKWTRDILEHPQLGEHLTCPALMTDIKLNDRVSELLSAHYPDQPRRSLLTVDQVSMDAIGLRRLVLSGSLHAALELTARFLSAHGQGLGQAGQPTIHTHKTLQMWSTRMALLTHLRLYKEAELELQAFGEMLNPDLYYQYHTNSYPGMKGSLVPFTLRLLHANLPIHTGDTQLALDRLCKLQKVCEQVLSDVVEGRLPDVTEPLSGPDQEVAEKLWKERLYRTKCCLANTLIIVQDYGMAMRLYEEVAEHQSVTIRTELLSGMGRLYLQLGDMQTATSYFIRVESELGEEGKEQSSLVKMNDGYLNVFLSRWQTASDCFKAALTFDPSNIVIQNNITVCAFYMGRLKESIRDMEKLLTSDPPSSLQPALFANLATTYELESGNSTWKKLAYVPLLAQHVGQGSQHLTELNIR